MIDTSKYEGHTEGPWKLTHIKPNGVVDENFEISFIHTIRGEEIKIADVHWTPDQADGWEFENWKANAQLIADTPLLPIDFNFCSSIWLPISGLGSIFQSPVCSTVPIGVLILSPFGSKIE